ncbi:MAG: dihydrodipicolinate synthase family protein [Pseudomonadota bacterium]
MKRFGLSTAMLTPFAGNGEIDCGRFCAHALSVLKQGVDSITLFGTTGEGASIGMEERAAGIEALLAGGCLAEKIVLGIAANSVSDASRQVAEGRRYGVTDFLLLPPCYFKAASAEGLFDWHMQLFQRSDAAARFILYHIPQVSGVALPVPLVGRIVAEAQDRILAIKDSSGSWDNARALLELESVTVLVGDERILHKAVRLGAGGAISGMANLYPERMKRIVETAQEDTALSADVTQIVSVPVVAALKAVLSSRMNDPDWERVRAPLSPLDRTERALIFGLDERNA